MPFITSYPKALKYPDSYPNCLSLVCDFISSPEIGLQKKTIKFEVDTHSQTVKL